MSKDRRPAAWMGPDGQLMPDAIYIAWSVRDPDSAAKYMPLDLREQALDEPIHGDYFRHERSGALFVCTQVSRRLTQLEPGMLPCKTYEVVKKQ